MIARFLSDAARAAGHDTGRQFLLPPIVPLDGIHIPIPELPEITAVAADSFAGGEKIQSADQLARLERLQGVYVKQVNDRLTRVLRMTDRGASIEPARCVVHVIQDEVGTVIDLDMYECERPMADQQRLARAIRAASPLPPPPAGLSMGSYLTLDVSSL